MSGPWGVTQQHWVPPVGVSGFAGQPPAGSQGFLPGLGSVAGWAAGNIIRGWMAGQGQSTSTDALMRQFQGPEAPPGYTNPHAPKRRRRRRKLLTCSDKGDIAFLHGQLGGGALGRAAISALLSRRCG